MEKTTIIALVIGLVAFLGLVSAITFGGITSQRIAQEKILSCIQSGVSALECKCAIGYCN